MSPSRRVTLPVEIKVRELEEKTLLAMRLASAGHEVIIGPERSVDAFATERGTDLHFVNGCSYSEHRARLYPALARAGVRILLLDTEGDLQTDSPTLRARFHPDLIAYLHRYLAWGPVPGRLGEAMGIPTERIRVTGTPRFDLLLPPYDAFHHSERDRIRAEMGRFILVNTNLTRANPFASRTVRVLAYDEARVQHQREMLEHLREALPALTRAFPGVGVVIRPHPGESAQTYRQMFAGESAVQVIFRGSVQPWIQASLAVVHNGCTTGVEAAMMGHPVVAFTPTGWERSDFTIANDVSERAPTIDALVSTLRPWISGNGNLNSTERRDQLRAVYANLDRPANETICEVVSSLSVDGRVDAPMPRDVKAILRKAVLKSVGQRGMDNLRDLRNVARRRQLAYARHKMSGILQGEMRDLVQRYAVIDPRLSEVDCEPVSAYEHTFAVRQRGTASEHGSVPGRRHLAHRG